MRYRSIFLWLVLLFVLGLVFNCVNVWAQSPLADNLNQELEQLATDSLRLQYCLAQARSASISEAAVYLREAVKIADRIDDPKSMAELYTEKAILENKQGNHMAGVRAFMKVDSISRLLGDTAKLAAVQTNLGLSHFYAGNKDMALQHYYEAYQLYNIINEPRGFSRLLNNLAICTKELNKLDEAEKYYRESLQLKRTLADSNGIATSLMNLGLLLAEKKQYEEALATLQEARSQYQEISAEADAFACQLSEGKIMIDQGQWDRALPLVQESYDYFHHQAPESPYLLLASGDLAAISINRKDYRLANAYLEEALVLAKKSDKLEVLRSLLKDKALVEYALQNYQRGFDALQESYILNDSINAHSKLALIEEMQTRFEVDAKEREITLLNTQQALDQIKLKNSRNRNLILILVGIALSIFSAFIYRLYFQINRQKKLISQALAERETLLKEIHHRVKNNLQVISSLLSMQSYQIQDKNALEAIQESRNRVKSMSLIHQSLYQDKGLVSIDSSEYIDNLIRGLFDSYNIDSERITLNSSIDSLELDVDIMIPLGLILNELISNALKYAFTDGRAGILNVNLHQKAGQLTLEVSDNGVGLPSNFDASQPVSLGHTLVQDFCKKMKAELKISGINGTKVLISIPNKT